MNHNNEIRQCEISHVHEESCQKIINAMPKEEVLFELAELYKVFSDSTRVKIMYVLDLSELCVCDIAKILNMSPSAISHQLRVLKQSELVKYRKSGKEVYYSLKDEHVKQLLNQGMNHINEGQDEKM